MLDYFTALDATRAPVKWSRLGRCGVGSATGGETHLPHVGPLLHRPSGTS